MNFHASSFDTILTASKDGLRASSDVCNDEMTLIKSADESCIVEVRDDEITLTTSAADGLCIVDVRAGDAITGSSIRLKKRRLYQKVFCLSFHRARFHHIVFIED